MKSNYLIAYFQLKGEESSCAKLAKALEKKMTAEGNTPAMFAITPVEDYPEDKALLTAATKAEIATHGRPEIVGKFSDGEYRDVKEIYLITPNWWNSVPMAVFTFFDRHDTNNKRLVPVVIHGGDGAAKIVEELRHFLPKTDVMPAVEVAADDMADLDAIVEKILK